MGHPGALDGAHHTFEVVNRKCGNPVGRHPRGDKEIAEGGGDEAAARSQAVLVWGVVEDGHWVVGVEVDDWRVGEEVERALKGAGLLPVVVCPAENSFEGGPVWNEGAWKDN
jgi:hypothetical protein